jgi:glutaredoxin
MKKIFVMALFLILLSPFKTMAQENNPLIVFLFTSTQCPYCQQAENYFEVVKKQQFPSMEYIKMSMQEAGAYDLLQKFSEIYKIEAASVPIAFIGDKAIIGYYPDQYRAMLDSCLSTNCQPPFEAIKSQLTATPIEANTDNAVAGLFSNKWLLAATIVGFGVLLAVLSLFASKK